MACACLGTSRRRFGKKYGSSCLKLTDINCRILYIRLAKNTKKCYNRYGNCTRAKDLRKEAKMIKTSIRFFDNIPVRAVWDDETSKWWFCAVDIAEALTGSKSPRKYWNTIKTRNPQLSSICRQLKLMAKDGKMYLTDVIDDDGVNTLVAVIPSKKTAVFAHWMKTMGTTLDEKSKQKAYSLYEGGLIERIEVGRKFKIN